jgi:hypothetical protein
MCAQKIERLLRASCVGLATPPGRKMVAAGLGRVVGWRRRWRCHFQALRASRFVDQCFCNLEGSLHASRSDP